MVQSNKGVVYATLGLVDSTPGLGEMPRTYKGTLQKIAALITNDTIRRKHQFFAEVGIQLCISEATYEIGKLWSETPRISIWLKSSKIR